MRVALLALVLVIAACSTGKPKELPPEKQGVRETISGKVADVADCYTAALKKNPKLAGKLILEWEINPIGDPKNVKVIRSVDKRLDQCMVKKLTSWAFEPPPDDKIMTVRYPFDFEPAPPPPPPPPPPPSLTSTAATKICPQIETAYAENCVRDEKTRECVLDDKQMAEVLKLIADSPTFEPAYLSELDKILKTKKPSRSEADAILTKLSEDCWTPIHLRMWTSIFVTLKANPKHALAADAKRILRDRVGGVAVPTPTVSALSMDVKILELAAEAGVIKPKGASLKDITFIRSRTKSLVKSLGREWSGGKVEDDDYAEMLAAGVLPDHYTRSPIEPQKVVPLARKELIGAKPIRAKLRDWVKKFWKRL